MQIESCREKSHRTVIDMQDESDMVALADLAVKQALAKGADQAEAWIETSTDISVSLERNDINSGSTTQFSGMGIRVNVNHGQGFASLNILSPEQIKRAAIDAIVIARHAPPVKHNSLPIRRPLARVEIFDPNSEAFEADDALQMSSELLNTVKSFDHRVVVDSGTFAASVGKQAICTSEGIQAEQKSSIFVWQLLGMAREGFNVGSYAVAFDATTQTKNINVTETATDFAEKAVHALGVKAVDSFSGSLLLTPLAAAGFILDPLLFSCQADNVQKGISQFSQKKDSQVVSECLKLMDDGTIPYAIGSSEFDREGVDHIPTQMIQKGRFVGALYNSLAANREQKETSGHATGSYRSVPSIGPTNLVLKGMGEQSKNVDQILPETERGIMLTRFSGNIDPISGIYSGMVKGGHYIENGEIIHPVTSVTIQGDIFESLKRVGSVAHQTKRVGSWILPELIELQQIV